MVDGRSASTYRDKRFTQQRPRKVRVRRTTFMFSFIQILIAVLGCALTMLLCLNAQTVCSKLELMDTPDTRKRHRAVTPLMGGIVLVAVFCPLGMALAYLAIPSEWSRLLTIWLGSVAAMAIIGLADDRHSLTPRHRLVLSFLVFAIAASLDPHFNVRVLNFEHPEFELGLSTGWFSIVFTTTCCVGLVNAVNMADGKNGLVIGLCLGWLALLSFRVPTPLLPAVLLLSAVLVALLAFNLRGRLFLGDGGAYGLASAIGLLAIVTYNMPGNHAGRAIAAEELVLLFAAPVFDSFRLTYVRVRRGQSPMTGDRDHLHHHLLDRFGWPGGLFIYFVVALLPCGLLMFVS
jgi:UDP-GlcNAc:undecaprenyl-phosphate/decaprenyl-phosphate GlcNAc-1-phosphate transferase